MSLNSEQLKQHCEVIIQSRRIKNKIVILCEGESGIWNIKGRPSPQSYAKMEQMPDSNFYNACVPKWWTQNRPQFFNCGDRKDVIDTFFVLLNLHQDKESESYLNPDKLFAIVDLDLQLQQIDNYNYTNTEEIFCDLYDKSEVNQDTIDNHRIFITGLIHKEAYFLFPDLQNLFDEFPNSPSYQNNPLLLKDIYVDMIHTINNDIDLQNNIVRAFNRINHCSGIDCTDLDKFIDSVKNNMTNSANTIIQDETSVALLTIKKAKSFWHQIHPPQDWTRSPDNFREQLMLAIARFYSEQSQNPKYHLSFLLEALYKYAK
jgi:hypothetical protein